MRGRVIRIFTWLTVLAVIVLHNDEYIFERQGEHLLYDHQTALFGWLPADVVYHLAWVVAGGLSAWMVLRCTWQRPEPGESGGDGP